MKESILKRLSAKRPKGARLMLIVGILSAAVWISALGVFLVFKGEGFPAQAEGHGHGGAMAASAHGGHAEAAEEEVAGHTEADESELADVPSVAGGESAAESADHESHGSAAAHHGESQADEHAGRQASESAGHGNEGAHEAEAHHAAATEAVEEDWDAAGIPTRDELAALRQVAELFTASGDMAKAVTPMRRVLRVPTQDASLLCMATDIFMATANYREALRTAGQVLALRPGEMRVKVQSVEALYRMGEVEKAFAEAQAVVKEHPGEIAMLTTLGTMEVEMGPGRPGYGKSLQAALKLKPDYAPALYLQGRKAQLEGDYKDAEKAFRKVVKQEPNNAKAHGQLGMALYHLGKENEAEKEYRAGLGLNPGDYNTWFNLGELQMARAGRELVPATIQVLRAEAMEAYLKALESNPDHPQAHFRVGVLLNGNGQFKEAIRHLEASLKADSRHVPTLVQLSLAFENLKQPERARAYLTKAFELDPLNKVVLFKLKQWS